MSNKIKPEELQECLKSYLKDYQEDIEDDVKETTDTITKKARTELKQVSREKFKLHGRDTPYYKGWSIKIGTKNKSYRYTKVIWNKTNYQLTHLLEFGHTTRNGRKTKAISHIRPIEEKYGVKFADTLRKEIGGKK